MALNADVPAAACARTGQAPKFLASGLIRSVPGRPPATRYRSVAASSPAAEILTYQALSANDFR
jgi:hypothetical protein